jgi:hypothetical protein
MQWVASGDRRDYGRQRTERERRNNGLDRDGPLDFGPYRAPHNHLASQRPSTDRDRVMWGLERAVDYNTSPEVLRGSVRFWLGLSSGGGRPIAKCGAAPQLHRLRDSRADSTK